MLCFVTLSAPPRELPASPIPTFYDPALSFFICSILVDHHAATHFFLFRFGPLLTFSSYLSPCTYTLSLLDFSEKK